MKKFKLGLLVIFALTMIASNLLASGGKRTGTAGASELLIPVGARGISMAGSAITGSMGVESIFYNPANLSRGGGSGGVLVSNMTHFADIAVQYGAVSANIEGIGSLALGIKSLNLGDLNVTTNDFPDGTGSVITPSITVIGLTFSTLLSDRVSVGLTANLISEDMGRVSASGMAIDIGVTYNNLANIEGFNFAIVLKNLGSPMKYDGSGLNIYAMSDALLRDGSKPQVYTIEAAEFELPSTIELGLGYNYNINAMHSFQINSIYKNDNFYNDEVKLGAEYSFDKMLFIRGGYLITPETETKYENIYNGIHAGFGIKYNMSGTVLGLDYAYRQMKYFDANHVVSLNIGF